MEILLWIIFCIWFIQAIIEEDAEVRESMEDN
jgi:hypothetical protein